MPVPFRHKHNYLLTLVTWHKTHLHRLNGELSGKATLRNDNIKAIFWENRTEPQKFGIQLSDGTWKYFLADES